MSLIRNVTFLIAILFILGPVNTIAADTTAPANITQTAATSSSLTIKWDKAEGAVAYGIRYSDDKTRLTDASESMVNTETNILLNNLTPATTYYLQLRTYINQNQSGNWSNPIEVNTSPEKITSILQTVAAKDGFSVQWSSVTGALYDVYLGDNENFSNAVFHSQTGANTISVSGLSFNTCKYIFIIPYKTSPNATFKAYDIQNIAVTQCSTTPTAPSRFEITHRSRDKKTTFAWIPTSSILNTDGYQLEIRNTSNRKIKTITVTGALDLNKPYRSATYSNSKLFNEPFQYCIRTYVKLDNGKKYYSDWSATKRYIPGAYIKKSTFYNANSTCRLNWKKVTGAKNYTIYWSKDGEHWKAIAKNVNGSTAIVKYNKSSKKNYYYVRSNSVKFGKKNYTGPGPNRSADIWVFK